MADITTVYSTKNRVIISSRVEKHMIADFDIDDGLLREALALTVHLTPKAIVEEALREYVNRRKQVKILELFGTVEYEPDYDYKQQRQKG